MNPQTVSSIVRRVLYFTALIAIITLAARTYASAQPQYDVRVDDIQAGPELPLSFDVEFSSSIGPPLTVTHTLTAADVYSTRTFTAPPGALAITRIRANGIWYPWPIRLVPCFWGRWMLCADIVPWWPRPLIHWHWVWCC